MSNINGNKFEIVITGGTGFVGSNLLERIVKVYPANKTLVLTGPEKSVKKTKLEKRIKKLGFFLKRMDLTNASEIKGLPKYPKLIIHLAAQTDTSARNHSVNDKGVKNFYEAFGKLTPKTHLIYIGTMINVSGRPACNQAVNEKTKYYPTNEYTRTKTAGEKYFVKKCLKDKFRLTILIPNTIYGKGIKENSLFDILKKGVRKGSLLSRLNWPGRSALIHVDDVTSTIISFSKIKPLPGKPQKYFLYAENLSISQISKIIHKKMGIKYKPIIIPGKIWELASIFRKFIPKFEPFLPSKIYNQMWRGGIIIDDVVWARTSKISRRIKGWKAKLFKNSVSDVLSTSP